MINFEMKSIPTLNIDINYLDTLCKVGRELRASYLALRSYASFLASV